MTGEVDILLVEDDPSDAELAIHELRRNNLANHIHVAEDGVEALDFVFCRGRQSSRSLSELPRMILLDLNLPKMNGFEVLEAIKQDPRTQLIPVVILSSSVEHKDLVESYRMGANAFIQKPVDYTEFRRVIAQIANFWLGVNRAPPRQLENAR